MDKKKTIISSLILGGAVIFSIIVEGIDCKMRKKRAIRDVNKNLDSVRSLKDGCRNDYDKLSELYDAVRDDISDRKKVAIESRFAELSDVIIEIEDILEDITGDEVYENKDNPDSRFERLHWLTGKEVRLFRELDTLISGV